MMKQHSKAAKKGDNVDKALAGLFEKMSAKTAAMIATTMAKAKRHGKEDPHAFLDYATEEDINLLLTSLLPVLRLEAGKYMLGTEKKPIQIKNDSLLIRVGGGYATLEEYLRQNGPFECIKIAKVMRDKECDFKAAVEFYLNKHKADKKVVADWLKAGGENTELFEKTIAKMRENQDAKKAGFDAAQTKRQGAAAANRASGMTGGNQNLNASFASRSSAGAPLAGKRSPVATPKGHQSINLN